jgi:CubicO group peptidase (beta-lactamase class C family)
MPEGTQQALGWWFRKPAEEATVFLPSEHSYGHTGFTGTSLWMDPDYQVAVILLANAVHPKRETARAAAFRKPFHTVISEWCAANHINCEGR